MKPCHFRQDILRVQEKKECHIHDSRYECVTIRKSVYSALLVLCLTNFVQPALSMTLGSTYSGSTVGATRGIFTNFNKIDVIIADVGKGGQVVVPVTVSEPRVDFDLQILTCFGSDYDTYLVLLDKDPVNATDARVLAEGANDIACAFGNRKAFLSTRVSAGAYFLLVTGNGAEEGTFNISLTGGPAEPRLTSWGLDRIDQRTNVLDQKYTVQNAGKDVWVYIIDSGIRVSHKEFETRVIEGYDFVNNKRDSCEDCTGHGTHVAGIIGGKSVGVATNVKMIGVRVFDCQNQAKTSALVDAISWVLVDSKIHDRTNMVVAMMFSARSTESGILQSTVMGLVRSEVPVVVPAGNNGGSACDYYPGSVESFLTVGASDILDKRLDISNAGTCAPMYAPGSAISSSWHTSDTASRNMSGTAQAAAHMVGIVAGLLSINRGLNAKDVHTVLSSISTPGVVKGIALNDTARFAYIRSIPPFVGDPPPERQVYIFVVLQIFVPSCNVESSEISEIQRAFTDILSVGISQLQFTCTDDQDDDASKTSKRIQVRGEVPERRASATFAVLEGSLLNNERSAENVLGYPFSVIEPPWSVDSTPIVLWGAPSFSDAESSSLSIGAIAGAIIGCVCLSVIVIATVVVVYRKARKLDEVESMEGSADMEDGPIEFDDFLTAESQDNSTTRSFRNIMRGMSFKGYHNSRNSGHGNGKGGLIGLNKMGSFIGGPKANVGKDLVRLQSFGGEAFAGMQSMSKRDFQSASTRKRMKKTLPDDDALSFRGFGNLVLENSAKQSNDDFETSSSMDESFRMQSLGGEAFAKIGRAPSEYGSSSFGSSQPHSGILTADEYNKRDNRENESALRDSNTSLSNSAGDLSFFASRNSKSIV